MGNSKSRTHIPIIDTISYNNNKVTIKGKNFYKDAKVFLDDTLLSDMKIISDKLIEIDVINNIKGHFFIKQSNMYAVEPEFVTSIMPEHYIVISNVKYFSSYEPIIIYIN